MNAYRPLESREHRLPAKRSGPLEGLPSGHTREAQWLDDDPDWGRPLCETGARGCRQYATVVVTHTDPLSRSRSVHCVPCCAFRQGVFPADEIVVVEAQHDLRT